jgi:hypothetical protein
LWRINSLKATKCQDKAAFVLEPVEEVPLINEIGAKVPTQMSLIKRAKLLLFKGAPLRLYLSSKILNMGEQKLI